MAGRRGDERHIYLIHGLGDSPRVWRGTRAAAPLKRYRFIVPALPGFGGRKPLPRRKRGIYGLADWLQAEIGRRSKGRRIVLVGHSMGGTIATLLGSRMGEVEAIINVEGPLLLSDLRTSRQAANTKNFPRWFGDFRRTMTKPEAGSGIPEHFGAAVARADPATFRACARDIVKLTRGGRLAALFTRLPVQATHFYGSEGISAQSQRLLRDRSCAAVRFDRAGHWPMIDAPAKFARRLARALG